MSLTSRADRGARHATSVGSISTRWRSATRRRVLELARRLGIASGRRVLDLGTGVGGPGRDIGAATAAEMFGVNLSSVQLRTLRALSERGGSGYRRVVLADMRRLPFARGVFDAAVSVNALYHVPEPELVLNEVARVLAPGGAFGLDDWFLTPGTRPEMTRRLRHDWSTPEGGFHIFHEIVRQAEAAGLAVEEVVDFTADAGAFLTADRFGATYDVQIAPRLVELFPRIYHYDGYQPQHAMQAVSQLRADILNMGRLYRSGEAVYRQIVARKPSD